MPRNETILKISGICAIATSITTFLLWLLPKFYTSPVDFESSISLHSNNEYMARQWVNLFHIPLALIAYFGLTYKLWTRELPKVTLGMMWFLIWGIVEMIGVSGIIFAVNRTWRASYLKASVAEQLALKANIESYMALWDGMFFVLLIGFLLGTIFFGWSTWKGKGIEKVLSYLFWLAAPLTLLIILSGYFGLTLGAGLIGIIYPILQPLSRFILGLYLLKPNIV